jgi:hypothetical protein
LPGSRQRAAAVGGDDRPLAPPARLGIDVLRLRVDFSREDLFRCARRAVRGNPGLQQQGQLMRSIISLYFIVGILLLVFGYFATGPCPDKNTDVVNDVVFVLTWPVELYGYVITGPMTPEGWLHKQACEGGLGEHSTDLPKTQ